jgi:tellurite resistance protein TehA-like permease
MFKRCALGNQNDKSPHILNTSSNLLGICFIVLTSLKLFNVSRKTFIDELTSVAIVLFMASCLLSFLSIRGNIKKSGRLENVADYLFLCGIILLFITTILFSLNIIK